MKLSSKVVIPIVISIVLLSVYAVFGRKDSEYTKVEIEYQERVVREKKIYDLNKVTVKELMSMGINIKVAKEVVEYREVTGRYDKIDELIRIKGIGEKTLEKHRNQLYIDEKDKNRKNRLNINMADEKSMLWYGFSKVEVKKVNRFIEENNKIYSNVELKAILGDERYRELYKNIRYKEPKKN